MKFVMATAKNISNGISRRQSKKNKKEKSVMQSVKTEEDIGVVMDTITNKKADGWGIQNLRRYHNSIIPEAVLNAVNGRKDLIPTLIEYASGIKVRITSDGNSLIAWEIL